MKKLFVLLACMVLLMSCVGHEQAQKKISSSKITKNLTPSDLNSQADTYDRKQVVVHGLLSVGSESRAFWDGEKSKQAEDINACVSILYTDDIKWELSKLNNKVVILRGVFYKRVSEVVKPGTVILGMCNGSVLTVSSIDQH